MDDKTYWNHQGLHQKLYIKLMAELVPEAGDAETPHGEVLRLASNLYYDLYNNGGCNIHHEGPRAECVTELQGREDIKLFVTDNEFAWDCLFSDLNMRLHPTEECQSCDHGRIECPHCNGDGVDPSYEDEVDCQECLTACEIDCEECEGTTKIEPPFYAEFNKESLESVINGIIRWVFVQDVAWKKKNGNAESDAA